MTETELRSAFARMREGDRDAFVQVYRDLSKPVYTVVLRILRHREAAEDVTQDVFVRLFTSPPDASVTHLRAWIFRMTRNLAIDALRTQHITEPDEALATVTGEDEVSHSNRRMDVARAMSHLPQAQREIVSLHVHGELTFSEIARIEGMSLAATYRAYRRATSQLREELEDMQ